MAHRVDRGGLRFGFQRHSMSSATGGVTRRCSSWKLCHREIFVAFGGECLSFKYER
jgi:hypothetical protein